MAAEQPSSASTREQGAQAEVHPDTTWFGGGLCLGRKRVHPGTVTYQPLADTSRPGS